VLTGRLTISYTTRSETGLLKTGPEIWSTFIRTYVCWRTSKLQAVNSVETTVEWEQWAVADSDSE